MKSTTATARSANDNHTETSEVTWAKRAGKGAKTYHAWAEREQCLCYHLDRVESSKAHYTQLPWGKKQCSRCVAITTDTTR